MVEFNRTQFKAWLREAIGARRVRFDAAAWRRRYAADLAMLAAAGDSEIGHATSQASVRGRYTLLARLAAMAAVLVIAVSAGVWLAATSGSSSRLFAQTLQQLQQRSYGFTLEVWADEASAGTAQVLVAEPGRVRFDQRHRLEDISTILDVTTRQAAVLFHRQRAAYLFDEDPEVPVESQSLAFLILPGRSILNLWSLRAGEERSQGRRLMDGREVEGFQVVRDTETGSETITVWADVGTGVPVQADVTVTADRTRGVPAVHYRLRGFDMSVDPEPGLFAMMPEGYTRANVLGLAELMERKGIPEDPSDAEAVVEQQQKVTEMFQLIDNRDYETAMVLMREIDWDEPMTFRSEPLVLALSETDATALAGLDRHYSRGTRQAMMTLSDVRGMAHEVIREASEDRKAGRDDEAEALLTSLVGLGRLLHDHDDRLLIARLTGIAIEQLALEELGTLYAGAGRQQDCARVETRNRELERMQKKLME